MDLERMMGRCAALEERAAGVYRAWAAAARGEPGLCALWTALAREEETHARAVATARSRLQPTVGWRTRLDGWEEAIAEAEARLAAAEALGSAAPAAQQLSAALELEMTELEALRDAVLGAAGARRLDAADHTLRLADAAERLSDDPQVRLQAALLRARMQLGKTG